MSGPVSWMLTLKVNEGKLDEFRALMDEMVTATREESGTLMYQWFLSDDGACHLHERYADDAATMVHLGAFPDCEHPATLFPWEAVSVGYFPGSPALIDQATPYPYHSITPPGVSRPTGIE
ncbi:MAG: antibiotic biosynthesis monooxygenase, partial [Gemmatimonadota bacterium]